MLRCGCLGVEVESANPKRDAHPEDMWRVRAFLCMYVHARQSSYWRQLKIFESGGPSVLPSPNITESANTYYIHPCASNLESRTEKRGAELEGAQQGRTAHSAAAVPLTEQKSQQFMMVHRCVEASGTHRPENKKKRKSAREKKHAQGARKRRRACLVSREGGGVRGTSTNGL